MGNLYGLEILGNQKTEQNEKAHHRRLSACMNASVGPREASSFVQVLLTRIY
jgi:hypothetical protein